MTAFQIFILFNIPNLGTAGTAGTMGQPNPLQVFAVMRSPKVVAAYLLLLLLSLALYGALMALQSAVARGDATFTVGRAVAAGIRRLPNVLLAAVVFGLALVVGTAALIIPGIWLWGRLQLWFPAMFADGAGGLEALGSSWHLSKGNWWRGATIITVGIIMIVVFAFVFSLAGGIVAVLMRGDMLDRQVTLQLFTLLANTITYPFISALLLSMHRDFKLRREGTDLAARVGALRSA